MSIRGDASEVFKLALDLRVAGGKAVGPLRATMAQAGEAFAAEWAHNAEQTSGEHGIHYPKSIDSELTFNLTGVEVEVGPNAAKKQGSMGRGFEFGSKNQDPHLDGLRAMGVMEPRVEKILDAAMGHLFP